MRTIQPQQLAVNSQTVTADDKLFNIISFRVVVTSNRYPAYSLNCTMNIYAFHYMQILPQQK